MDAAKAGVRVIALANPQASESVADAWRVLFFGPNPNRTLCRVVLWGVLLVAIFHQMFLPIQIIGSSMSPTYSNGSLNFVNRWSYTGTLPNRGDVIALRTEDELLLKRIVALPGEKVAIEGGEIFVNGNLLIDDFSQSLVPWQMEAVHLGPGEYFVIGDNRSSSVFGKIAKGQILGKVVF